MFIKRSPSDSEMPSGLKPHLDIIRPEFSSSAFEEAEAQRKSRDRKPHAEKRKCRKSPLLTPGALSLAFLAPPSSEYRRDRIEGEPVVRPTHLPLTDPFCPWTLGDPAAVSCSLSVSQVARVALCFN